MSGTRDLLPEDKNTIATVLEALREFSMEPDNRLRLVARLEVVIDQMKSSLANANEKKEHLLAKSLPYVSLFNTMVVPQSKLIDCVVDNNIKSEAKLEHCLDKALSEDKQVDMTDGNRRTPLMWAVKAGNEFAATWLLNHGADINAQDTDGCTALIMALKKPDVKIAIKLLEQKNMNVMLEDNQRNHAYHYANACRLKLFNSGRNQEKEYKEQVSDINHCIARIEFFYDAQERPTEQQARSNMSKGIQH